MAAVTVKPFVFRDAVINLKDGATDLGDFQASIPKIAVVPTTSVVTIKGLTPSAVYTDIATPEWKVAGDFLQDWETAAGLSIYTFNNPGKQVTLTITPKPGVGIKKLTAVIVLVPTQMGGDGGAFAAASFEFAVIGQPTIA